MSESTHQQDQRHAGDPQITGGGGHEPDPSQPAAASGVGGEDERRGSPDPDSGAAYDLKTSDLPEPKSDSGT